jgi:hypothetical protein
MKIWTLTYNDDNGVRTEVFNSAEAADKAAHVWITEYWDDHMVEEHGLLPESWSWAYEKLCETLWVMGSIHVETHNIYPPGQDQDFWTLVSSHRRGDEDSELGLELMSYIVGRVMIEVVKFEGVQNA